MIEPGEWKITLSYDPLSIDRLRCEGENRTIRSLILPAYKGDRMPIQYSDITFPSRKDVLAGYVASPEGAGPYPGIVVIHEAWGLNENIKDIARRFANEGYAALAVDLFTGRNRAVCMFRFLGGLLLGSLNNPGIRDLKAALDYFASQPFVDADRLGAIGFCMGGGFAIAWACTDSRLKVIAPFYGVNPRPLEAVQRLCPVVGSYPGSDFTAGHGRKLDAALDDYNIPHEIKVYPGAKHSFFNDTRPASYDSNASAEAWNRTLAYFQGLLK